MPLPGITPVPVAAALAGEFFQTPVVNLSGQSSGSIVIPTDSKLILATLYNVNGGAAIWTPILRGRVGGSDAVANYLGTGGRVTGPTGGGPSTTQFAMSDWPANSIVNGDVVLAKHPTANLYGCRYMLGTRLGSPTQLQQYAGIIGSPTALSGPLSGLTLSASAVFSSGQISALCIKNPTQGAVAIAASTSQLMTGIPATAKTIYVAWHNASMAGGPRLRLGHAGGIVTSYDSFCIMQNLSGGTQATAGSTAGFDSYSTGGSPLAYQGMACLTLADPTNNIWACTMFTGETTNAAGSGSNYGFTVQGQVALPAVLDRIEFSSLTGAALSAGGDVFWSAIG